MYLAQGCLYTRKNNMGNFMRLRHYSKTKPISEVSGENMPVMQRANDETSRAAEVHIVCEVIEREKHASETKAREEAERQAAQEKDTPADNRQGLGYFGA